jgi:outer membrane protein
MVFSQLGVVSLKKNFAVFPALILGFAVLAHSQTATPAAAPAPGPPPTKVGIINATEAIAATKEGQKAGEELQKTVVAPRKEAIDKLQAAIQANNDKLRKGAATLSLDAQKKLQADIDADTKTLNRSTEDAQSDVQEQESKIMQELGTKMMTVLSKYAADNGYAVILDVSNQQQGTVLWAAPGVDITPDIVKLYDAKYPLTTAPAPSAAKPPAAAPAHAAQPPAAPPAPARKQ